MRITDLLDKRSISLDAAPKTKSEALDMAVDLMVKSEKISDREAYRKQVYLREEESTTGIGEGIAIPHGKCDAVKKPGLAAMVVKNGVEFEALDDEPDRKSGHPSFPDRGTEYRRQHSSGCTQQTFRDADG